MKEVLSLAVLSLADDAKYGKAVGVRCSPRSACCLHIWCMLAILITPPTSQPGEAATLASLVNPTRPTQAHPPTAIHVRKPGWDRDRLAAYVSGLDPAVRALVVLHSHHDLVSRLGLKVRRTIGRERGGSREEAGAPRPSFHVPSIL